MTKKRMNEREAAFVRARVSGMIDDLRRELRVGQDQLADRAKKEALAKLQANLKKHDTLRRLIIATDRQLEKLKARWYHKTGERVYSIRALTGKVDKFSIPADFIRRMPAAKKRQQRWELINKGLKELEHELRVQLTIGGLREFPPMQALAIATKRIQAVRKKVQ